MCGIVGCQNEHADELLRKGLMTLHYRGKDGVGVASARARSTAASLSHLDFSCKDNIMFGHTLHAIVDVVPQPFLGKGMLVVNGEIYNWKELAEKCGRHAVNDAELLFQLLEQKTLEQIPALIEELDGDYAFAYAREGKIILARDIIGVKPLWIAQPFAFASERKALYAMGFAYAEELNPRQILIYDTATKTTTAIQRNFFIEHPELDLPKQAIIDQLHVLFEQAVQKRIPEQKLGILFSGGIDSTLLAWFCKKHAIPFTCYTAAVSETAEDLVWSRKVAQELDFPLKEIIIDKDDLPALLKELVPLIESSNVVKVGVALPLFCATRLAKEDHVKILFSGLGSEELFAGYERHLRATNINKECIAGLRKVYERDLYRDDVLTMYNTIELRVPFLDRALVDFAVRIPAQYKIVGMHKKHILRELALQQGLPEHVAFRPKRAAQYGSKFDAALEKLAKQNRQNKSAYLKQYYDHNLRLGVLFSTGKDSNYALYIMQQQNYDVTCLITISSENPDSYMYHTPTIYLAKEQADCLGLPLLVKETAGEKEEELVELEQAIREAKEQYALDGIVTGALYSTYQRDRIERVCEKLGLKVFHPLWHKQQEEVMRQLIDDGFQFILTKVAAEGLDKSWLGRVITHDDVDRLVVLSRQYDINVAGEGGEFESFVLYGPLFKKALTIKKSHVRKDGAAYELVIDEHA
ncbi:MAG: diphthine--ammonia ligase [archaeon]